MPCWQLGWVSTYINSFLFFLFSLSLVYGCVHCWLWSPSKKHIYTHSHTHTHTHTHNCIWTYRIVKMPVLLVPQSVLYIIGSVYHISVLASRNYGYEVAQYGYNNLMFAGVSSPVFQSPFVMLASSSKNSLRLMHQWSNSLLIWGLSEAFTEISCLALASAFSRPWSFAVLSRF